MVKIHLETDGSAIVAIAPCPLGVPPRRLFTSYDEAWPYADSLAKKYTRVEGVGGSWARSVTVTGPIQIPGDDDGPV